jgi:LEA14-like dessication related protein
MKLALGLLACLLPFLCSCRTGPGPAISLVNVRFAEATAFETTATFTLRLSNETPEPMQLDGGVHKIYLNGLYVGEGLNSDTLDLPRLGTATQEVTVHLNNIGMATRIKPIIESRSFDYRIKSLLYGKSPGGHLRSASEGRLDLKDFTPTPSPP